MENRFVRLICYTCGLLVCLLSCKAELHAQVEFTFDYTGPDTLYTGTTCTAPLDWGHPNSLTATCMLTAGGACDVDSLEIFSISNNAQINDLLSPNDTVQITYRAFNIDNAVEGFFSFTIVVADTSRPVWTANPMDLVLECDGSNDPANAISNWLDQNGQGAVTDNCGIESISHDYNGLSNSCGTSGQAMVTFTAIDSSGNSSSRSATIIVEDTEAPSFIGPADITIDCTNGTGPAITGWILQVQDACDLDPDTSFNDIVTAGNCVNSFIITRTWILVDACGNVATPYVQRIQVLDETPPVFLLPASNTAINCTTEDAAEAAFQNWIGNRGEAFVADGCSPANRLASFAAVPGSYDLNNPFSYPGTPVGTLDTAICPTTETGVYRSETVDFVFYDECNNAAVSQATFQIIDDIPPFISNCPPDVSLTANSGSCEANYLLPFAEASDACVHLMTDAFLSWSFQINDLNTLAFNPDEPITVNLPGGENTIRYFVTDCSGNTAVCTFRVRVEDEEAPLLVCPDDLTIAIDPSANCSQGAAFTLPPLNNISDNCTLATFQQTQPSNTADAWLRFSLDADYEEYIADDKAISFVGTTANAVGNDVQLIVRLEGDVISPEAYYTIFDEQGNSLGTTEVGQANVNTQAGDCNVDPPQMAFSVTQINIPIAQFNSWAADGSVDFNLQSNKSFADPVPGGSSDGINPYCTNFAPGTPDQSIDSISRLSVQLIYTTSSLSYQSSGATNLPLTAMPSPSFIATSLFQLGTSTISYQTQDVQGNTGTCSFDLMVEDQSPPETICENTTIFVDPSGAVSYILQASEVDGGSSDNCSSIDLQVTPNTFSCDLAGSTQLVELIGNDIYGNSDTCTVEVQIASAPPEPDYSVGLCGNDTLYLFANPPAINPSATYSYEWAGPNSFSASEANPFIPNANALFSGTYKVTITGATGCTAVGSVDVLINPIPNTPVIQANNNQLCVNDELVLSTQTYSGTSVNYHWYSGIWPGGSFMTTTDVPMLTIPPPLFTNTYYLIVEVDACSSAASAFTLITVSSAPTAVVNETFINICEGATINLGTNVAGPNYAWTWTGPNGYFSDQQYPDPIEAASLNQAGTYTLVISSNGCPSAPDQTTVNIRPKPNAPSISGDNLSCEGGNITLLTDDTGADFYTWIAPSLSVRSTTAPTLSLFNVSALDAGEWTLQATLNGCTSDPSAPFDIFVEVAPDLMATNDGPGCVDGEVLLSANEIPGALYEWSGPGSFSTSGRAVLAPSVFGTYSVTVTSSLGCSNTASTFVDVQALPVITAISNTAANCVDGNSSIELQATIFPPDDGSFTYQWSGPANFSSNLANPTLPTGTSADNGTYHLIVSNGNGCASLEGRTEIMLQDIPAQPILEVPPFVCEGGLLNLSTSEYLGSSVLYIWETPLGTRTSSTPELIISPATMASSGIYSVRVEVDGCISLNAVPVEVAVTSTLPSPIAIGNGPVCEGQNIELSTEAIVGATYRWIGPNNYMDSIRNPILLDATQINEGGYSVQISINGCSSPFSVPVGIQVNEAPAAPELAQDGPVCIDEANASLVLSIVDGTGTPGASYTFYDAQSQEIVGGPTASTSLLINDFSSFVQGQFDFYAITTLNSCPSAASTAISVSMDTIPDLIAMAGMDQNICDETTLTLNAIAPSTGMGMWLQMAGPAASIQDPNAASTMVSGLSSENSYRFQWSLSNGACRDYSTDDLEILVDDTSQLAEAGEDIELCNQTFTNLAALAPLSGAVGRWTQSASQQVAGVDIDSPDDPSTIIRGLEPGSVYTFNWVLSNPACGDYDSDEVMVIVEAAQVIADAGMDFEDCGDGQIVLMASPAVDGIGAWIALDEEVELIDADEPDAMVEQLVSGTYQFVWSIDYGVCGIATDTVEVNYVLSPIAEDDEVLIPFAGKLEIDVLENDQLEENDFIITVSSEPSHGQISYLGGGIYEYRPVINYAGEDEFSYLLCSSTCPDICEEATVRLNVGNITECEVPSIFTPNNDLVNDVFLIPCLATDRYPRNRVIIFNQWGDEVFNASPYQNDWAGIYDGNDLPAGTYYYVIDLGTDETPLSGFLVLER